LLIGSAASIADLDILMNAGYDYIELSARYLCGLENRRANEVIHSFLKRDFQCLGFNAYCPPAIQMAGPLYNPKEADAYTRKCLAYARELDIRHIGVGSPLSRRLPPGYPKKEAAEQIRGFLTITADIFGAAGIYVCLEALAPCYCNYINTLSEAAEIINSLNHPFLAMVPDFYNMELSGESNLDLSVYLPLIRHVHISDDDGSPALRSFLKSEKFPIHGQRLKSLLGTGYNGALSVEIDVPADLTRASRTLEFLRGVVSRC
jgi:sugar phosphate isomerase/epimerase